MSALVDLRAAWVGCGGGGGVLTVFLRWEGAEEEFEVCRVAALEHWGAVRRFLLDQIDGAERVGGLGAFVSRAWLREQANRAAVAAVTVWDPEEGFSI